MSSCPMLNHFVIGPKVGGPHTLRGSRETVYPTSEIAVDKCDCKQTCRTTTYKITTKHRIDQQKHGFPISFRDAKNKIRCRQAISSYISHPQTTHQDIQTLYNIQQAVQTKKKFTEGKSEHQTKVFFIVFAAPRKGKFLSKSLLDTTISQLQSDGHQVSVSDLYAMNLEIPNRRRRFRSPFARKQQSLHKITSQNCQIVRRGIRGGHIDRGCQSRARETFAS